MDTQPGRTSHSTSGGHELTNGHAPTGGGAGADLTDAKRHQWQRIALGRVCTTCQVTQAKGEFDDQAPCVAS